MADFLIRITVNDRLQLSISLVIDAKQLQLPARLVTHTYHAQHLCQVQIQACRANK